MRAWLALALVAMALGGCGGGDGASAEDSGDGLAVPWSNPDGDLPIVGPLTVNPADSMLYMSTNTGLFRVAEGASKPEKPVGTLNTPDGSGRVSESLLVRFEGPDQLLGSGHPSAVEALPPALGLMRSVDAGKTWSSVSELGTADFHAIEPAGDQIVAALFQAGAAARLRRRRQDLGDARSPDALVNLEVAARAGRIAGRLAASRTQ